MTRRATILTIALLLTAAACSSEASSGTSVGATTVLDDTTTTVLATTVAPDAGATTSIAAGDTTASADTTAPPSSPPTPPPAPTAPTAPTAPPTTTACREVGLNETVQRGDCGDTVTFIQERLTLLGFPVTADGQFGAGTERVVKDFQTSRGLTADGIVGEATWAALVEGGIGD